MLPKDVATTPEVEYAVLAVIVFILTPPEILVPIADETSKIDFAISPLVPR